MDAAPLTLPEFGACLAAIGGFETRPLVAVAVSGGPDSMALMLLTERWARAWGGRAWGLTVDHGLRRESAGEARQVGLWLGARAIPHEILRSMGPKPESGIQEAAREARYRLLAAWCRDHRVLHLVTAHHLEDQIETHLIRRRAGSGVDGLAGMSAVRELLGCRLVRPLLPFSRWRLTALLATEGQPFLVDPSNLNPAFERARLRLELYGEDSPLPTGKGVGVSGRATKWRAVRSPGSPPTDRAALRSSPGQALSRSARKGQTGRTMEAFADNRRVCARARIARGRAVDALSAQAVALHSAGFAALDPAALAAANSEMVAQLLSRVVVCLGGLRYPARQERLERLRTALAREPRRARTLGGCRFVPWRDQVLVLRELAAAQTPFLIEPGVDLLWDRRFAVALSPDAAGSFTFGYLGQHVGAAPRIDFASTLPPLVRHVLPAFWDRCGLASVPHLGYCRPGPMFLAKLSFRPLKPLAPPSFTVV